jgi:hypothetical protein
MTTSLSIHGVTNITTDGVSHDVGNAINLNIDTDGQTKTHRVTLFGLPTHVADALEELLGSIRVAK